jgi:HK97 family phage major capsid protein
MRETHEVWIGLELSVRLTKTTQSFGNFKLGVAIRDVVPTLLVSKERYAESLKMYPVMFHRQDCQVVDTKALSVLQQAAS